MIQPNALYQFTGQQLIELAGHLVKEALKGDQHHPRSKEMCTRQVKQHLLEKGYRVTSAPSLLNIVTELKLTRTKRGKEYWYPTAEVEAIPSRLTKPL